VMTKVEAVVESEKIAPKSESVNEEGTEKKPEDESYRRESIGCEIGKGVRRRRTDVSRDFLKM
jgi:hypothetical protein